MEILKFFISPIIVGIFMFLLNRNQKKRDKKEDEKIKELSEREKKHMCFHNMQTEGMLLLINANKLALESLKKLKDENGKALINGELATIKKDVSDYHKKFEKFIIEK